MPERRRAADLSAAVLAGGSIALLSFADGGFFESAWPPAAIAFAAAAGLAALLLPGRELTWPELVFCAGLAGLAGWQALSAAWSLEPADSLREGQRGVVYFAAALAFVTVARRSRGSLLIAGVVWGTAAVAAYSVAQRVIEGARDEPFQGLVLNQPLGYANALGALAAVGLVGMIGLAAARASRLAFAVAAAFAALFAATLALTSSRGSWLAAAVGVATLAVFRAAPTRARVVWLGALGLAVAAVLVSPLVASLTTLERGLSDRPYYWWTAWHAVPDYTPLGSGGGTFDVLWAERAPIPVAVRDAHSLYLEALVELGPLGLALILLGLLAPVIAALRSQPSWPVAGAAGAYVAFLFHAGIDWDWEMPAVTVAGIACGGALLAGRPMPGLTRIEDRWILLMASILLAAGAASYILGG